MDVDIVEIEEHFTASREVRRPFEGQWLLNLAFHDGKQWMAFDGRQLHEPTLEPWRAKLVDNRIRGMVRKEIARMTKSRPVWVGVPASSDDVEIDAARLRERLFEHDWQFLDMTRKRRAAHQWSRITGAGFLKFTWDSSCGPGKEILVDPETNKSVRDANGRPIDRQTAGAVPEDQIKGEFRTVRMGEPRCELRTPFEVFPDALATEDGLESCRQFGEESVYDPEYVKGRFNVELEPDADATPGVMEARLSGITSSGRKRGVRLREYWCLPCSTYAFGAHVVYVAKTQQVLLAEAMPYPFLPYVMMRGAPRPGSFWPVGIDDLISPQTELNKSESQIAENGERIGNPPLTGPSSADFDPDEAWLPGTYLEYQDTGSPNARPEFMKLPELPGYVQSRPERAENSLREISHQHEVTSGNVPAGVTAASAINLLQEADDTVLGPDIEDMELAIRDAGRRMLWLRWKFSSDERMIRIAGEDGAWDWEAFKGQMLRNGGENDEVQAGSGMPQSRAAKQAAIQQVLALFVQNNVPLDERRLRRVLRDFEVGGLENMLADVQRDERQVNEENRRLFSGEFTDPKQTLLINSFDNDAIHIAGHEDAMKTPRWTKLGQTPEGKLVQQAIEAHVVQHRERQAEKELAAAQPPPGDDTQPPPGGGGPAPSPPAPGAPPPPPGAGGSQ